MNARLLNQFGYGTANSSQVYLRVAGTAILQGNPHLADTGYLPGQAFLLLQVGLALQHDAHRLG